MSSKPAPSPAAISLLTELQKDARADFNSFVDLDASAAEPLAAVMMMRQAAHTTMHGSQLEAYSRSVSDYITGAVEADRPTPYQDVLDYKILSNLDERLRKIVLEVSNHGLPDKVLLGSLPIGQCNALTLSLDATNEYLILFQNGIFGSFNLLAGALMSVWPEGPDGLPLSPDRDELVRAVKEDKELHWQFLQALHGILVVGDPRKVRPAVLSPIKSASKEGLLGFAELFVLAHEYGHIRRGDFDKERGVEAKIGNRALTIAARFHQEEFAADMHAEEWLTRAGTVDPMHIIHSFQGIAFFFACQELLEDALGAIPVRSAIHSARDTHPAPADRFDALVEVLGIQIGYRKARIVREPGLTIKAVFRTLWEAVKEDWIKAAKDPEFKIADIWLDAVECQARPKEQFEESEPDRVAKELLGFELKEVDSQKGAAFLCLLHLGDENRKESLNAARWIVEHPHIVVLCLIHELSAGESVRRDAFTDYLVSEFPGIEIWITHLRFVLSRYRGNPDILGVPAVMPEFMAGCEFLAAIAQEKIAGTEPDYFRLYFDAVARSGRSMSAH